MLACLVTLPAFIALTVLFFWTATSGIVGGNNDANGEGGQGGGEYRPWWDFELGPEGGDALKIIINLFILVLSCATLLVPINKAGTGLYERFNEGVLAASLFMFGNMLFVSFWYQINFRGRREEDANAYNGYDEYYYYWAMDEQERVAYHQKVTAYVSLALSLLFYAVSACHYSGAKLLPESGHNRSIQQAQAHGNITAQFDILKDIWRFISLTSFVTCVSLFIAACVLSDGEEAERMKEEGRLINLILVLLCMVLIATVLLIWGMDVFTVERGADSLGVGMMYGSTKYFSALLFMVCVLFANPTLDEREREESIWVATATSLACFFLSLMHIFVSMRTRQYQVAIIDASENAMVLSANTRMVHSTSGDFVRVDERGMQMA